MWKFVFVGKGKTTMGIMSKIFGTRSQREVKRLQPLVGQIEALGPACQKLSDGDLAAKTKEFQQRYQNGETLDALLPEAFAVCREAADRVLGMRPYPVQLIGGIVLHQGRIAEMKTGEGKTLVAILPAYLNALAGKGVHIVTVNEYLAKRDSEWMGKVYRFLGLTVGLVIHGVTGAEKPAPARIFMHGQPTFKFAVKAVPYCIDQVLEKAVMAIEDVDFFVFHQANARIIDLAAKKYHIPPEKYYKNIQKYGNTSAASIPLVISELHDLGKVGPGSRVLVVGFGGGLTWGGALVEFA